MDNIIKGIIHRNLVIPRCIQEINILESLKNVPESEDTWGIFSSKGP